MFFKKEKQLLLCLVAVVVSSLFLMTSCAGKKVIKEEPVPVSEAKIEEKVTTSTEIQEEIPVEQTIDEEALREEMLKNVANQVQDIFFAFDRYNLSDMAKKKLENTASALKENAGVNILIEGHCDERGTVEYNLVLGEKRASTAKKYLVNLGVAKDRINTISYGEESPFDSAHNEISWTKNRRAHFVFK